jgi:signal transduction histidine kinase
VRQILAETESLGSLISDLFELSQIDVGNLRLQRESCDLRDLLSDTVNAMQLTAEQRGVELRGTFSSPSHMVYADSAKIQRVLTNLVQNALQHSGPGGTVTIRAEEIGSAVQVAVSDRGNGISPEDLPHIFERFYRADQSRTDGGAGLGLTIARGIVEAHGGEIWATSEAGSGTTIRFTIPHANETTLSGS